MIPPKISIIIPIYNAELYLKRCLNSVVSQTLQEIEILCIDDCGTDNSLQIIKQFAEKDHRIKIIENEINIGQALSRNKAIQIAQGEYIGFVDNDDWIEPNMFEIMYHEAIKQQVDILSCDYVIHKKNRAKLCIQKGFSTADKKSLFVVLTGKEEPSANVWTKIYSKSFLSKYQLFFTSIPFIEDYLFNISCYHKTNHVGYISEFLYHYNRSNYGAMSSVKKYRPLFVELIIQQYQIFKNYVQTNFPHKTKEATTLLNQEFVRQITYAFGNELVAHRSISNTWKRLQHISNQEEVKRNFTLFSTYPFSIFDDKKNLRNINRLCKYWLIKKIFKL